METYFTSDWHLGHKNIIEFSNRPFANVQEMDAALVNNWNSLITNADTTYVLGDVSFHSLPKTMELVGSLNGKKVLIWGNHDAKFRGNTFFESLFSATYDIHELKLAPMQYLILCHYPFDDWNAKYHGSYHAHGHKHSSAPTQFSRGKRLDVGVDAWDYKPVSLDQLVEVFQGL